MKSYVCILKLLTSFARGGMSSYLTKIYPKSMNGLTFTLNCLIPFPICCDFVKTFQYLQFSMLNFFVGFLFGFLNIVKSTMYD